MDLQERYDELDLIISTLDILIDGINDKDYKEQLELIKFDAQDELDRIEPILQEEWDKESNRQLQEYINSVI